MDSSSLHVSHQTSPLVAFLADFDAVEIFKLFGVKQFLPSSPILQLIAQLFCNGGIVTPICEGDSMFEFIVLRSDCDGIAWN